jgi:Ras-related protein Rab-1A
VDLENQRQVQKTDGEEWAKKLEVPFLETSAKDAQNVDEAFTKMVERLFVNKVSSTMIQKTDENRVVMNQPKPKKKPCLIL